MLVHSIFLVAACATIAFTSPIMNGEDVKDMREFSFVVLLETIFRKGLKTESFGCAGTIISRTQILTAAHCLQRDLENLKEIKVNAGVAVKFRTGQKRKVVGYRIHSEYVRRKHRGPRKPELQPHDIAVLWVGQEFRITEYVSVANLQNKNFKTNSEEATAVGWGLQSDGYESDILQKVQIMRISKKKCKTFYDTIKMKEDNIFCAIDINKCSGPARGDSGGPLISGSGQVIGVMSMGKANNFCRNDGQIILQSNTELPVIYTNVFGHKNWIQDALKNEGPLKFCSDARSDKYFCRLF